MDSSIKQIYNFSPEEVAEALANFIIKDKGSFDGEIQSIIPVEIYVEPPAGVSDMGSPIKDFGGIKMIVLI
jgi:hypothetical protein